VRASILVVSDRRLCRRSVKSETTTQQNSHANIKEDQRKSTDKRAHDRDAQKNEQEASIVFDSFFGFLAQTLHISVVMVDC